MGYRTEKAKENRRIKKIRIVLSLIAFVVCIASCLIWFVKLYSREYAKFITITQTAFLADILLYISIVSFNLKFYTSIVRSFLKLFYSVWIVSFILLTITNQYKQNIILIFLTFFIGYLEVLLDLDDVFKGELSNHNVDKLFKFSQNGVISTMSKQITITLVALMNVAIAFLLQNSIASFDRLFK